MNLRNSLPLLLIALAIVAPSLAEDVKSPSKSEVFQIDATHSTAMFRVHHLGAGMFYGRFNEVKGTVSMGNDSLEVEISIPITSVDTGSENLDKHLRSPEFFDVEKHPEMTFKSKSVKKTGSKAYKVTGDLTIHGVTKTITADVEHTGTKSGRRGKRCGFETTFTVKRSEYGMNYGIESGALGDETKVVVSVEAVIPPRGPASG